ncbi:MAG: Holliday junction branch migration DNA helicase RuvB [Kiritimatiellae bacterium]|nr:Holliday junction branch migration DNA helicase RuvB [Kiritimatiellia bacterium]MDD5519470.1 Holliday junction branch migration DNA helicase RuvB [Kiritimatiellia bacterium]
MKDNITGNSINQIRPQSFSDFVGQEQQKEVLSILAKAAKKQGKAIAHTLLSGPPGLGKTTLCRILAEEMGTNLVEMVGSNLEEPKQLQAQLAVIREHDIVFIDEIHSMNRNTEEVLYSAMEDGLLTYVPQMESLNEIMKAIGLGGSSTRAKTIRLPAFTLIGATTLPGLVSAPLRSRFVTTVNLEPYSIDELKEIVIGAANKMKFSISEKVAEEIARRSRNTARLAVGHLTWLREFCFAHGHKATLETARQAFLLKDIDENGLTKQDRSYLSMLVTTNAPVGLGSLAASLNESIQTLEQTIEPFLLREGYIRRGTRGRVAEQKAYELLKGVAA